MKVSNNALNFLLAQYRAIFKRAYVKGLASAVMLTAALAAGQAQAAAPSSALTDSNVVDQLGKADTTIVIGNGDTDQFNAVTISGTAGTPLEVDWKANLKITSGATTANYIKAQNDNVTLTGTGSLTIDVGELDATNGLAVSGGATANSGTVTVDIDSVNVTKGTLAITAGSSGSATVAADTITIGSAESKAAAGTNEGIVTLAASKNTYNAILGNDSSQITIDKGGKLELKGTTEGAQIVKGESLNVANGGLFLVSAGADNQINVADLKVNEDSYLVISGGSTPVNSTFAGKGAQVDGNFLVMSGGTLNLNTEASTVSGESVQGTVTLGENSNTQIGGTLTVNSGTLKVDSGAALHASDEGAIKVVDDDTADANVSTLKIDSKVLEAFLTADRPVTTITNTGTTGTGDSTAGSVLLSGSTHATLEFTDETQVDLTKFNFSGATAAEAGHIVVDSSNGATIKGKNIAITDKLTNSADTAMSSSKLMLVAEKLSLGAADLDDSTAVNLGFSGATTHDLTVAAEDGTLTLANKVTLDVTMGGNSVVGSESGTVTGNFVVTSDGPLTFKHGTYNPDSDITISGGTLTVTNGTIGDGSVKVDTKVTLDQKLTLDNSVQGTKISVDGDDVSGATTVLDITKAELVFDAGTKTAAIEAVDGGVIIAKGDQLNQLLKDFSTGSGNTSGASVFVNNGTFQINGDVALTGAQLTSAADATNGDHKFTFHSDNGGTLEVDGELKLTDVNSLSLGGDSGAIVANILNLNNGENAASLTSGSYTALSSLTSNGTAGVEVGDTASVFLGRVDGKGTSADPFMGNGGGSLSTDLKITDDAGSVTVVAGDWTGSSDITVTKGTLTVGDLYNGAAYLDADGEAITASLDLGNLDIGTEATAKVIVNETGTLTTNGFKAANTNALTVDGTVTIKGVADSASTPTYGISVGEGSVQVNAGGQLRLDGYAVTALGDTKADASGDFFTTAKNSYTAKGISVAAGGEVYINFAKDTSLSAEALKDLRAAIFATEADGTVAGSINIGAATISGITPDKADGKYDWNDLQGIGDVLTNFTFDELKAGTVKNIETGDQIRGHFGALESSTIAQGGKINIVGNSSLNAAANGQFATGLNGAQLGLNVAQGVRMDLNNGGAIGEISLAQDSTLGVNKAAGITNPGKTTIAAIDGASGVAEFGVGEVEVTGETRVANLVTSAQGVAIFGGDVTVGSNGSKLETDLLGSNTFNGAATFNTNTEIGDGSIATFNKGVEFASGAGIYGNTSVTGGAEFGAYTEIGGAATLTADAVELTQGSGFRFVVGEEDYIENGLTMPGSTGYLQAKSVTLNGNTLVIDPSYDHATSVAAIESFDDVVNNDEDAGTFEGDIFVGQNAALGVGQDITIADVQSFIKQYQNSRGALSKDEVGSVLYIDGMLTATNGSHIILDSQHTQSQVFDGSTTTTALIKDGKTYVGDYTDKAGVTANNKTNVDADLYLGQNTIMAVSDNILSAGQGAAIHFDNADAAIMAQSVADKADAAKIVLDGNAFLDTRDVTLFTAGTTNGGVKVLGDQDIRVETLNGVMYFMLNAGEEVTGGTLNLDTTKIDSSFLGATDESRDLLFAYSSHTANWESYFDPSNLDPNDPNYNKVQREELHGDAASKHLVSYDKTNGGKSVVLSQAAIDAGYTADDFVAVPVLKEDGTQATDEETGEYLGTVYHRAYNDLLEAIVRNTNGAATDSAALQGVFGGAAQAALLVARTSQEAVAGRTGVGASSSALTFADNGQGAGLWVNPIYLSSESDGFEVDNKEYGVDIDLYGIALGGDYTLANGVRVGAFFNVGSGEADGNGQANGVSNDFDYYGVGLYAGYTVGQFSIVGDVSYSVVDSEVDASTAVGKITSSFDTDNLSVGVTGQYEFDFNGTLVTPHVGLRYSALSVDDYRFKAANYTQGGEASIDDANVFSIPVGVTVAKEFAFDTWTVKPSLDVTVQGNFGDDELDSAAQWDNVAWQSNYSSEFIDNFTYGATLGVAAKTGAFSAGVGLGYQGSSNTDEFSATANARFVF